MKKQEILKLKNIAENETIIQEEIQETKQYLRDLEAKAEEIEIQTYLKYFNTLIIER